ncbi:MAG: DUF4167 domain-containing protein [Alphaproteobacteria bacterium]|nr:DUF4167 domain-containing protein [Alphaproteobacteria bacterium]
MRHGTANRRQRNRSNGGSRRSNQQRMQVYDSNGPDVRIRGTAHQVAEKYLALAKDAYSAGDRIMAESYYQHAEHYIRIINEFSEPFVPSRDQNEIVDGNSSEASAPEVETKVIRKNAAQNDDDLALPASILGGSDAKARQTADAQE